MKKNRWTGEQMPSLNGKVAIVTGANSGLGYETVKGLSRAGASVIMACRNMMKGEQAKKAIEEELSWSDLTVLRLNLADLGSVMEFAQRVEDREERVDLLINNAGLMAIPFQRSVDGYEMQFAVNHLGHFALTGLLFPLLKNSNEARIVNVSSMAHKIGKINFSDLQSEQHYSKWKAYGQSKLANLLFTHEINRRLNGDSENLFAVTAHPGYSATQLVFKGPEMEQKNWKKGLLNLGNRIAGQPASMGALPTLFAATSPDVVRGAYYGPGGFAELHGYPVRTRPRNGAVNDEDARKLWDISMKLSGVKWLSN